MNFTRFLSIAVSICAAFLLPLQTVFAQPQLTHPVLRTNQKRRVEAEKNEFKANSTVLPQDYTRDGAKNIFDTKLEALQQRDFVLHREVEKKEATDSFAAEKMQSEAGAQAESQSSPEQELSLRDRMIKEYGDPSETEPLTAISTAPKSYQAIFKALDEGNDDLAYEYAIRYRREQKNNAKVRDKLVRIETLADYRLGEIPIDAISNDSRYQDLLPLLDKEIPEEKNDDIALEDQAMLAGRQLNSETRKIIEQLEEQKHDLFNNRGKLHAIADELDERIEREKARKLLKYRLPVDPGGKIGVFFFFKHNDDDAQAIAADVEKLSRHYRKNKNINFLGLSIDRASDVSLRSFKNRTGISFAVKNGEALASKMKVSKSPTLLFTAQSSGKFHVEEGLRNYYYLDEVIKIMQGS